VGNRIKTHEAYSCEHHDVYYRESEFSLNTLSSLVGRLRRSDAPDEGVLWRQVITLALPAAGEQVMSLSVGIVNTMLVGHLGASPLAAVSLATQWTFAAFTFYAAIATGATAVVARSVGAGDWESANRATHQSIVVGFAVGLIMTVLALLLARPAVALMGAEPEALAGGVTYMRIVSVAFGFSAVMFVGNACLRGAGDTRTAMLVMGVVNAVNVCVSWTAINGPWGLPRLGVAGTALGEAAGRTIGGLLVVFVLLRGRLGLKLDLRHWRLDPEMIRRVLRVGLPTGGERAIMRVGMMIFMRVVASLGTTAVAAHSVALRAESLSWMPGIGFATAGTTLVGQNLGARDPERAERSGYIAFQMALILMSVMGVIFMLFPRPLVALFTDDEVVIQTAVSPLRIIAVVQPMMAAAFLFAGNLRGAGDTRFPMYITGASVWVGRVVVATVLVVALGMGLPGAWLGMATDHTVRGALFFLRYRSGRWKLMRV
jgi:MATE family multidrug resistance protein